MNHQEFENLTGLKTTFKFYDERVEPQYMASNQEKAAFCEEWVKLNRKDIVKAVLSDIERASHDLCLMDCYKAETVQARVRTDEVRKELEEVKKRLADSQNELGDALAQVAELKGVTSEIADLRDDYEDLRDDLQDYAYRCDQLNGENLRLKAKLYDLLATAN